MQRLKTEDGSDPRPVLQQLEKYRGEYFTAGGNLSDDQYKAMIICSLPDSYTSTVRTILASANLRRDAQGNKIPLTPTELLSELEDIARDTHSNVVKTSETALAAGEETKCNNCGKTGHWKKDCWSKGGGKEGKGPGRKRKGKGRANDSANVASSTTEEPIYSFVVATDFSKVASQIIPTDGSVRLLDSGASRHFEPRRENFTVFRAINPKPINSADGRTFYATGEGNVTVSVKHDKTTVTFQLTDVLYSPGMPIALVSISRLVKSKLTAHFKHDGCHITDAANWDLFIVPERNGLYPLVGNSPTSSIALAADSALAATSLPLAEFHRRMGHAHPEGLKKMVSNGIIEGIKLEDVDLPFCEPCVQAKQTCEPFPKARSSPIRILRSADSFRRWGSPGTISRRE